MPKIRGGAPFGASLVVLSSLFYASYGVWTTLMGNFFGGYTASALRSILVLLILLPLAFVYRQFGPVHWRRNWKYLVGLVATSVLIWGPLYYAILHAGVGISLAVNYASMVIGMFFFGWLMAGEQFSRDKWWSAFLGVAGLVLVFSPSVAVLGWLALGAALVSGISNAAHMVVAKKVPYNATQTTIFVWLASVIANIPMAFIIGEHTPAIGWLAPWFYLVVFAVTSVAASWTFIKGVKLIEAGAAGVIGLLEIVFAVLLGVLFFGERPGLVTLIGVAVIIVAAAIPYAKDYNERKGTLEAG